MLIFHSSLYLGSLLSGHLGFSPDNICKSHSWLDFPRRHLKLPIPSPTGHQSPSPIGTDLCANSFPLAFSKYYQMKSKNKETNKNLQARCFAHLLLIISLGARKSKKRKKNADTKQQLDSNFWREEMKDSASCR